MIKADYHIHSNFSPDAIERSIEDYVLRALELGLDEICITDHIDIGAPFWEENHYDFENSLKEIDRLSNKYPQIKIKKGMERGLTLDTLNKTKAIINSLPFDFIIASQHLVDGLDIFFSPEFFDIGRDRAYFRYLEEQYNCLKKADTWNVIGHIGYFTRVYDKPDRKLKYSDAPDIIDAILKLAVDTGRGIEVNSAAYNLTGDFLPPEDILKRYLELGGEIISLGSDCHNTNRLYDKLDLAMEVLAALGFKYICTFEKLEPKFHKMR